jgi:hypothetical protein
VRDPGLDLSPQTVLLVPALIVVPFFGLEAVRDPTGRSLFRSTRDPDFRYDLPLRLQPPSASTAVWIILKVIERSFREQFEAGGGPTD